MKKLNWFELGQKIYACRGWCVVHVYQFLWVGPLRFRRYFYFKIWLNFPFRPWTIVHGCEKIELIWSGSKNLCELGLLSHHLYFYFILVNNIFIMQFYIFASCPKSHACSILITCPWLHFLFLYIVMKTSEVALSLSLVHSSELNLWRRRFFSEIMKDYWWDELVTRRLCPVILEVLELRQFFCQSLPAITKGK